MKTQTISQKFQPLRNDFILGLVSGSLESLLTNSDNITNPYSMQSSTNQELRYFNFVDTINGFSNLKTNWDSYNADAISKNAIDTAIETLNYLLSEGLLSNGINISVFPMRDGGVQFEFEGENICSELEINPSGELTFILFDDNGNIVDKWQLFELSELSTLQRGMSLELTYPELELFRPTIIPAFDWASPNYGHWYPKTKRGAEIRETILLFCHHMAKSKERSLQRYWAKVDYSMM